jgi:peroxiredoxin
VEDDVPAQSSKRATWILTISLLLNVALIVEVAMLANQNRQLKLNGGAVMQPTVEPLKAGERVSPFSVLTLDGDTATIDYSEAARNHLLFVFTTTCPHCAKTITQWNVLTEFARTRLIDVSGVSLDGLERTKSFFGRANLEFYTVAVNDTSFRWTYKISGVPETILIDSDGRVLKVWMGELNEQYTDEIMNLMGTQMSTR